MGLYTFLRASFFSPDLDGFDDACFVENSGFVSDDSHWDGYWAVTDSYGIFFYQEKISNFALRTVLVTTLHIMFSRMVASARVMLSRVVTSAATTTVWIGIPAGGALRTLTTATVCVVCSWMVTFTTTFGISAIPTETKTPSTLLHVLGVIYMKREEMML